MDWETVINHFKKKQLEDPMFFYTFEVDRECRMKNLFWRDGRSKLDYHSFGDVLVCNATFRISKSNLRCALFVRVNYHGEDVLLGSAFLSDESVDSFTWLFEMFLDSRGGQQLRAIFTNLRQEMSKDIEMVFPATRHNLSLWHILKDAKENLRPKYETPEFKQHFNQCFQGCLNETEFQDAWNNLIHCFSLGNNSWLQTLHEHREKWCHLFNLDNFSAKFKSIESSQSVDSIFNHLLNKRIDLIKYVHHYEKVAERMRSQELEDDFLCKQGAPPLQASVGILKHAADVYTAKMCKMFEKELLNTLGVWMEDVSSDGTVASYNLYEEGQKTSHCTAEFF